MELKNSKGPRAGKLLAALALTIIFVASLFSPRFWKSDNGGQQSVLARLGSPRNAMRPGEDQPKPASRVDSPAITAPDISAGGSSLANDSAVIDAQGEIDAQIFGEPILTESSQKPSAPVEHQSGPRIFATGATTEVANAPPQDAPRSRVEDSHVEDETPVILNPAGEQRQPVARQEPPRHDIRTTAEAQRRGADLVDASSVFATPRTVTMRPAIPANVSRPNPAESKVSPEELIRARWPWLRPRRLAQSLDRLEDHAACHRWAEETRWLIESAQSPGELADNLGAINGQIARAEQLLTELEGDAIAADLRRAAYALQRNYVAWEASADSLRVGLQEPDQLVTPDQLHGLALVIQSVESRLAAAADRAAWRDYLRLDELAALATVENRTFNLREDAIAQSLLEDVVARFENGRLSATQREFLQTGPLGELYSTLLGIITVPINRLELLTAIEQFEFSGLPRDAEVVAELLIALRQSGSTKDRALANSLDGYYRNNNARVVVSDEILTRLIPAQADRSEYTSDTILGVPVRGQSTTKTRLAMRMAPGDSAALELLIMGDVDALTQGESGPVRTLNTTNAQYIVHKKLVLDGSGIRAMPGRIDIVADSQLQCLETDFDDVPLFGSIVRAVAEDHVHDSREEARREVEQRIAAKVLSRVDQEADAGFAKMNSRLFRNIATARELGLDPAAWIQHPDENRLAVHVRFAGNSQLAAHSPRPRALSNSLASVQLHQSALNNTLEQLDFNGRTLTIEEVFFQVMEKLDLGMSLASNPPAEAEITFAEHNPITVSMDQGLFKLSLRVSSVATDRDRWGEMAVHVTYRPVPAGVGYALRREGVISLESRELRLRDTILLRGVFARVFDKDTPITVFHQFLSEDARMDGLAVTQFDVEDGWLGISIGPQLDRIVDNPRDESLDVRR